MPQYQPLSITKIDGDPHFTGSINEEIDDISSGLSTIMSEFRNGSITAIHAISLFEELRNLGFHTSRRNHDRITESVDLLKRKARAETSGEPEIFRSASGRNRLFIVGRNYLVTSSLFTSDDAIAAIQNVSTCSRIAGNQYDGLTLKKQLYVLGYSGKLPFCERIRRLFGKKYVPHVRVRID